MSDPRATQGGYWQPREGNPYLHLEGDALEVEDDRDESPQPSLEETRMATAAPLPVPTMHRPKARELPRRSSPYADARPNARPDAYSDALAQGADRGSAHRDRPSAPPMTSAQRLAAAEAARARHDAAGAYGYGYRESIPAPQRPSAAQAPRARQAVPARKLRFWKWYRTLPILVMLVAAAASAAVNYGLFGIREWLYPIHYESAIEDAAEQWGVDPLLVASIIRTESGWNADAISKAGAVGLMQLMPETAQELADRGLVDPSAFSPQNLQDPATNIAYGTAYLAYCLQNTDGLDQAIAAYNAGLGAAQQWASEPSAFEDAIKYPETTSYLERVQSALANYLRIYPDGIGEGHK